MYTRRRREWANGERYTTVSIINGGRDPRYEGPTVRIRDWYRCLRFSVTSLVTHVATLIPSSSCDRSVARGSRMREWHKARDKNLYDVHRLPLHSLALCLPLSTLCSVDRVSCHSPRRDTEWNEWSEGTKGPSDSREWGGERAVTEKERKEIDSECPFPALHLATFTASYSLLWPFSLRSSPRSSRRARSAVRTIWARETECSEWRAWVTRAGPEVGYSRSVRNLPPGP